MSSRKFDFSDIKLIKMPDQKKIVVKKFKKPKFRPKKAAKKPPEVVTLSDSEDSKDQAELEIIEPILDTISILESSSSEDENDNPSVEVITLDDSGSNCNKKRKVGKARALPMLNALDYIPIPDYLSNKFKNKAKINKKRRLNEPDAKPSVKTKKARTLDNNRVAPLKTPILQLSHTNIHKGTDQQRTGLRPVVIDGSNVAFGYGNGKFEIKGVIIVIQYFLNRGHTDITCFLPAHFRHLHDRTPDEKHCIEAYERDGLINYTPSRKLNGKTITPYDDRFIVQYASVSGGVIITNDGYRDLYEEEPSWKETIEKRLINYTFVKDVFMLPKDPLGRHGPSLDEILKFS